MKIVVTNDDGQTMEYEGRDADNFMFCAGIGSDVFNTLVAMTLLGQNSFHAHAKDCQSDSFSDVFLNACTKDDVESINKLIDMHYGGVAGLEILTREMLENLKNVKKEVY